MDQLPVKLLFVAALLFGLVAAIICFQRRILFYPSHHAEANGLVPWNIGGRLVGYARTVPHPKNVWIFTHGNAGQAADRVYALPCFSVSDSVFILEYPGYGSRPGSPSKTSLNAAAEEGYRWLRRAYPKTPVCAVGESIGGGPASNLARLNMPPDKIVLVVPFDTFAGVAKDHFPFLPAALFLLDRWNNVEVLSGYAGKVEIFGAAGDRVIPVVHARNLANSLPGALYHEIRGGHNDWCESGEVYIRN